MQPTLTLNCHKLVQNIKIRINVPCDECVCTQKISQSSGLSACLFLQSWIWAFEVSSLSQSYELQKLKWHFSVKKNMFYIEWTKQFMRLFLQEKKKWCFESLRTLEYYVQPTLPDWWMLVLYPVPTVVSSLVSSCFIFELIKSIK